MTTAQVLFNDYNQYRFHTSSIKEKRAQGAYIRSLKDTPERMRVFERLGAWCGDRSIDPRHWLYSIFVSRHWRFAPPLNQLTSAKHLVRYAAMEAPGYQDLRQRAVDLGSRDKTFNVNRDLSHSVEMLKRHVLRFGGPGRCMDQMQDETLGYHPRSKVCETCPAAAACEAMLRGRAQGFDIIALRRGDITLYQAQAAAAYGGR